MSLREGDGRDRRAGQHRHRSAGQAAAQRRDRRRVHGRGRRVRRPRPCPRARASPRRPRASTGCCARTRCRRSSSRRPRRRRTCANAPRYAEAGIQAIDLTPAHLGPMVCPPVNLRAHIAAPERLDDHLRRAGDDPDGARGLAGHAGAVRRDRRLGGLAQAGPGTRANIDEFTADHGAGRRGGRRRGRGKAIIILNPVEPPMIMRDTVFCAIGADADQAAITRVDPRDGRRRAGVRARLHASGRAAVRRAAQDSWGGNGRVAVFLEVKGNGDYLPRLRRQPRHHDRRGRPGGRADGAGEAGSGRHDAARRSTARRPHHRHHPARRQPRDGPPVHRDAGARHRARARPARASRSSR